MATGNELKNKGVCGVGDIVGYNTEKGCGLRVQDIEEIRITPIDFQYDDTVDFDADYLRSLQKEGNLMILKDIVSIESQSTETQMTVDAKGFESVGIEGVYKWRITFNNTPWFQKQLKAIEGILHKRIELVDKRGTIFKTEGTTDDKSRGFKVQHITRALQTLRSGTTAETQMIDVQLRNKEELDDYPVVIDGGLLDRETKEIASIVQAQVYVADTPLAGDTEIYINAVYDQGSKGFISGLTSLGDFIVYINGVEDVRAIATDDGGEYTLATGVAIAANDVITVSLRGVIEVVDDCLYTSASSEITAIS